MPRLNPNRRKQLDMFIFMEVPEESLNLSSKEYKKLALDFYKPGELEQIKLSLSDAAVWDMAVSMMRLSVSTLLSVDPNRPEWKWEAAWMYEPTLNLKEGERPAGPFTFEALASILQDAMPEEFGDISTPEELREFVRKKMPPRAQEALASGAYRIGNPYPEAP